MVRERLARRPDVRRAIAIMRRRRLDGRFAPEVTELGSHLVSLEVRQRIRRLGRLVRRRGPAVGSPPSVPFVEVPHVLADEVLPLLVDAGVAPFLTDARSDGPLCFAVAASARRQAHRALLDLDPTARWQLETERGGRRRTGSLHARTAARRARRAERWSIFRPLALGEVELGRQHGIDVTFWTPGANGRMERLGRRGLHRYDPVALTTIERVAGRSYPGLEAFPVERSTARFREPVDVVITWVDGADPAWRNERERWRCRESVDRHDQAVDEARFASHDELRYVLRSSWLHAGWIRRVFVVTAGQRPDWLVDDDRLRVVPHSAILPDEGLPTFNSHAIEANLHHIDGLAEHFLYLNDDMFFGRAVSADHFFTPNGLPRFFESQARIPVASPTTVDQHVDLAARRGRDIIAGDFGVVVARKLHHAPYALRTSVLYEIEQRYATDVAETSRHRFRHPDDLSIPSAFAHHYGFVTGRAVPGELAVAYENLGGRRLGLAMRRLELARDVDAFCINETETWHVARHLAVERLESFLEAYFPVPSPWERPT